MQASLGWGQGCRQVCHEAILENSSVLDNWVFFYFEREKPLLKKGKGRVTETYSELIRFAEREKMYSFCVFKIAVI